MASDMIKTVVQRLRATDKPLTPETFAAAYRAYQRDAGHEPELHYTGYLTALQHAMSALQDLLVGDAWLRQRVQALGELLDSPGPDERARLPHVRAELDRVVQGKPEMLREFAIVVAELRRAISETIAQVRSLGQIVGAAQASMAEHERLANECTDEAEAARIIRMLERELRRMRESIGEAEGELGTHQVVISEAGKYVMGAGVEEAEASV